MSYNYQGWSALHMAAMNAKLECIKFLVENLNIDPDINSQTGYWIVSSFIHFTASNAANGQSIVCVSKSSKVNFISS